MEPTCTNCGQSMEGKYCSTCGQKKFRLEDWSIKQLVVGAFKDFSHFDFKLFKDLPLLLFKPGYLTAEFIRGRINSHIKPITMFLWLNVFFFLGGYQFVLPQNKFAAVDIYAPSLKSKVLAKSEEAQLTQAQAIDLFNGNLLKCQKSMFFFVIPLFAFLMFALFLFQKRNYYIKHFVYSIHFWSYFFIFFTVFPLLMALLNAGWGKLTGEPVFEAYDGPVFLVFFTVGVLPYTFFAVRRVFGTSWWLTSILAIVLLFIVHFTREWAISATYYLAYHLM